MNLVYEQDIPKSKRPKRAVDESSEYEYEEYLEIYETHKRFKPISIKSQVIK